MSTRIILYLKKSIDVVKCFNFFGASLSSASRQRMEWERDYYSDVTWIFDVDISYRHAVTIEYLSLLPDIIKDDDGYWCGDFFITCDNLHGSLTAKLIALTLAKYLYTTFGCETAGVDTLHPFSFFYGSNGLVAGENSFIYSLGQYPFPENSKHYFSHLYARAPKMKDINETLKKYNFIIHFHPDTNIEYVKNVYHFVKNHHHPDMSLVPQTGNYIVDAYFIGPVLITLLKDCWSYNLSVLEASNFSMALSIIQSEWSDVLIRSTMDICERIKTPKGYCMVTTGEGDVLFILKNNTYYISEEWRDYFSKYPLASDRIMVGEFGG